METWILGMLAAASPVATLIGVWLGGRISVRAAQEQQERQRQDQIFDHERHEIASFTSTFYSVHHRLTTLVESPADLADVLLEVKAGAREVELAFQRLSSWAATEEAKSVFPPVLVGLTVMDYFYIKAHDERGVEPSDFSTLMRSADINADYKAVDDRCRRMLEFYIQSVESRRRNDPHGNKKRFGRRNRVGRSTQT